MKHEVWIGIGSNADAETTMPQVRHLLTETFSDIAFSTPVHTAPVDFPFPAFFTNQIARCRTALSLHQVTAVLKEMERQCGRKPEDKAQGKVYIDLDVLQYDDMVVKKEDFRRPFVHEGIKELTTSYLQ